MRDDAGCGLATSKNMGSTDIPSRQIGKILKLPFTGAIGILLRMREKELTSEVETLRKLEILRKYGRYRAEIVDDVGRRLEAKK